MWEYTKSDLSASWKTRVAHGTLRAISGRVPICDVGPELAPISVNLRKRCLRARRRPASTSDCPCSFVDKHKATRQELFLAQRAWDAGRVRGDDWISQQLCRTHPFGVRKGRSQSHSVPPRLLPCVQRRCGVCYRSARELDNASPGSL